MSGERRRPMSPEELRARDAVRDLPREVPDPEFLRGLRAQFTRPGSRAPAAAPKRRWVWIGALAATAALAVAITFWLNAGDAWTVQEISSGGRLRLDGATAAELPAAELTRRLGPGTRIQTEAGCEVRLRVGSDLLMVITEASDVTLPETPGRWWSRDIAASLRAGEIRFVTGPDFGDSTLTIHSDEARVLVRGTTLAVIRDERGTCLCVYEGEVDLQNLLSGGDSHVVPAGKRQVIFKDASASGLQDLEGMERMKLQMLDDLGKSEFE